jgi:hypothetical protein
MHAECNLNDAVGAGLASARDLPLGVGSSLRRVRSKAPALPDLSSCKAPLGVGSSPMSSSLGIWCSERALSNSVGQRPTNSHPVGNKQAESLQANTTPYGTTLLLTPLEGLVNRMIRFVGRCPTLLPGGPSALNLTTSGSSLRRAKSVSWRHCARRQPRKTS